MIELIDAQTAKPQCLRRLKRLFKQAFPWYERKPWQLLRQTAAQGRAEFLAVQDGRQFCGLAICLFWQDVVLLDYLAVEPRLRSQGLGRQILPLLQQRYAGRRLLLEVERPGSPHTNLADCRRRLDFYRRCGMQETGVTARLYISEYLLLWAPGPGAKQEPPTFAEYTGLYNGLFGPLTAWRLHIEELPEVPLAES